MGVVVLYVAGMVMFGCLNTETTKMQFTMTSIGLDGEPKLFHKPWQAVFTMFTAMSVVLIYHFIFEHRKKKLVPDTENSLSQPLSGDDPAQRSGLQTFLVVGPPALFDLLGTGCSMIGFVYLSASISQMLRGCTIAISAVLSVILLGRKQHCYNWLGVVVCMIGITLVGLSNIYKPVSTNVDVKEASVQDQMFGTTMNLVGQVFASLQIITEEKLLKNLQVPPMQVVGYEGVWGVMIMIVIMFPLLYSLPGDDAGGSMENALDTWRMLNNNPNLFCLIGLYIFSCSTYNIAGMLVTGALSGVHRMMLEASRTMFIWIINLCVFYFIDPKLGFGEEWTNWSWIQLIGFLFVIFGQTIYGAVVKIPGFTYSDRTPVPSPSPGSMYMAPALMEAEDGEELR